MGAFAPVAFRGDHSDRWATLLMLGLLAAIGLSLFLEALFNAQWVQANLFANTAFPVPGTSAPPTQDQAQIAQTAGLQLVSSYFNRTQEALTMYLLLLFGLKATEQPQ